MSLQDQLSAIAALLHRLNPLAKVFETVHAHVALSEVLNTRRFDMEKVGVARVKHLRIFYNDNKVYNTARFTIPQRLCIPPCQECRHLRCLTFLSAVVKVMFIPVHKGALPALFCFCFCPEQKRPEHIPSVASHSQHMYYCTGLPSPWLAAGHQCFQRSRTSRSAGCS
jgi:hypothetical protein